MLGRDDLARKRETLAAARLAPAGPIGAVGASGAVAGRLADFAFANRITDTNDHGDRFYLYCECLAIAEITYLPRQESLAPERTGSDPGDWYAHQQAMRE